LVPDPQASGDERRRHPRFPHGDLNVQLHRVGLRSLLRSPPVTRCIDFSLSGLQVVCKAEFAIGDHLVVDLTLHGESVEELTGVVCSRRDETDGTRYGIRFCFEKGGHMRAADVNHGLRRIASQLRQSWVYAQREGR
jgi:hypothetical protein